VGLQLRAARARIPLDWRLLVQSRTSHDELWSGNPRKTIQTPYVFSRWVCSPADAFRQAGDSLAYRAMILTTMSSGTPATIQRNASNATLKRAWKIY
jgi:hypothetical protein